MIFCFMECNLTMLEKPVDLGRGLKMRKRTGCPGSMVHQVLGFYCRTRPQDLNLIIRMSSQRIDVEVLIVGAGPAGLAAAVESQRGGLGPLLVLEKGPTHSSMIRTFYKEGKRVDARYAGLEAVCQGLMCLRDGNRESFLSLMDHVIETHRIPVRYNTEVWQLRPLPETGGFVAKTVCGLEVFARFVIIAIGKMGRPRQPDYYKQIPASLKQNSSLLFDINSRHFEGANLLVVGGGDSAAEYATLLSEKNTVTISYRKHAFTRLNPVNHKILDTAISTAKLRALLGSDIESIDDCEGKPRVHFKNSAPETQVFDAVIFALGGMTPVEFLRSSGVGLDENGEAITHETRETSLPGLYIVGDLLGKARGGGSIISGFNSATEAVRDIVQRHCGRHLDAPVVALDHLRF